MSHLKLPPPPMPFIGRKQELAEIMALLLTESGGRLLTLAGPGGIGKTRLALEVGYRLTNQFQHGVYFVPLAPLDPDGDLASTVAESLDLRFYEAGAPKQQLLEFLRSKQMLLVLDNFEHLLTAPLGGTGGGLGAAGLVADILQVAPQVKILVTSRERLQLSGETIYTLSGLRSPDRATLDIFDFDAVQLLIQQARLAQPGFEPQLHDFEAIVHLCQLTQGMPLALVLAAGWLETFSFPEIAGQIARSFDILETELRDMPERQRSVRAVFDYSWKRLSSEDQQIFSQLSVFRGGFTRPAAQTVAGANLRSLRTLLNKSFISLSQQGRYEIHELLRQYAEEKLVASSQADHTRQAHSNYYLNLLRQAEADIKGSKQLERIKDLEADLENIRYAWDWALEQKTLTAVDRALEALYLFFYIRSQLQEGIILFEKAQIQLKSISEPMAQVARGRVLARLSVLQSFMQTAYDNKAQIEQGLAMAQQQGQEREIAFCLLALGAFYSDKHEYTAAVHFFEQSLDYYRRQDDPFYLADLYLWLGHCYSQLSGLDDYRTYMQRSLALSRQTGDKAHTTIALVNLGDIALCAGDYRLSVDYSWDALALAYEMGRRTSQSEVEVRLGLIAFLNGELDRAVSLTEAGLAKARDVHYVTSILRAQVVHSLRAAITGDYALASQSIEESMLISALSFDLSLRNWALAVIQCGLQDYPTAWRSVQQALSFAHQAAYPALMAWPIPVAALLLAHQGRTEWAVELLGLAFHHPLSPTGWINRWPLIGELRHTLETGLEPEVFQRAWRRGRAGDLETVVVALLAEFEPDNQIC